MERSRQILVVDAVTPTDNGVRNRTLVCGEFGVKWRLRIKSEFNGEDVRGVGEAIKPFKFNPVEGNFWGNESQAFAFWDGVDGDLRANTLTLKRFRPNFATVPTVYVAVSLKAIGLATKLVIKLLSYFRDGDSEYSHSFFTILNVRSK